MNSIKKLIYRIIRWSSTAVINEPLSAGRDEKFAYNAMTGSAINQLSDGHVGINFIMYSAIGGQVIQVRSYDRVQDRSNNSLYIITEKDNLGEELAQIITRENLTR